MKKRVFKLIIILIMSMVFVQAVAAHPLGNFTISRYSRLQLSDEQSWVTYFVDVAEIPTFQERQIMDTNEDETVSETEIIAYLADQVPQLTQNLNFELNGKLIPLQVQNQSLTFLPGQGDLPTMRLALELTAVLPPTSGAWQLNYTDNNFANRLGWQEIVVKLDGRVDLVNSTVPTEDVSQGLTTYPENLLQNPMQISSIGFQFAPVGIAGQLAQQQFEGETATPATNDIKNRFSQDEFGNLLTTTLDSPSALLIVFMLALGLGAAHALTPGHGKSIVGAYLVGSRGTPKHAFFLGITTTLTHTAGVFILGFIVLFASKFILPEQIFPWLGVMSGALVVVIGFSLFRGQLHKLQIGGKKHHTHNHDHDHGAHTHAHLPPDDMDMSWHSSLALGVSDGLVPCPSALVLLLSAIALNKVGLGLLLIVAFSIGLAGVLSGIGLVMIYTDHFFQKRMPKGNGRLLQLVPIASALFVTIAGLAITIRAFSSTGII